MDIGEKLARLPKDGKHFTPEELMEEKLKEKKNDTAINGGYNVYKQMNIQGVYGTLTLRRVSSSGLDDTFNLIGGEMSGRQIDLTTMPPRYTVDVDLIEDIDDIKAVLKAVNKKLLSFDFRDEVKGIEHLVVKRF